MPNWRDDVQMDQPTGWLTDRARRHRERLAWARGPRRDGPLRRSREDGLAGGVAAGLAWRTGIDANVVRLAIVVLTLVTYGFAAACYVLVWLVVPADGADASIGSRALSDRRGIALTAGLVSLLTVVLLLASAIGAGWLASLAWPQVISVAGLVLIWRNASPDEQAAMRRLAQPLLSVAGDTGPGQRKRSRTVLRIAVLVLLLIIGLALLLSGHHRPAALLFPLVGVVLVAVATIGLLGPWWLRIARDLVVERQARIRAEERAEMATRVHDSVLQTLALIQRRADDPQRVVQLARAQERELRSWLFDGRAPGSMDEDLTVAAGIRLIQQEVEAQHGVAVEAVTVGDCELDEDLRALLAAAREATVNAVKWSGAEVVSIFAEVEPAQVSVFVRDRGQGFDPDAVPSDRKGLAESVHARMTRRGGSATVRSAQGEGTEVSLTMPRAAGERQPSRA
jgi:signal transduction histidine kinase